MILGVGAVQLGLLRIITFKTLGTYLYFTHKLRFKSFVIRWSLTSFDI